MEVVEKDDARSRNILKVGIFFLFYLIFLIHTKKNGANNKFCEVSDRVCDTYIHMYTILVAFGKAYQAYEYYYCLRRWLLVKSTGVNYFACLEKNQEILGIQTVAR